MHQYGVRDVEKLLRLPRSTIRALIEAGFVSPARGSRNAWLFSFQDLIVLRTAQALAAAKVPRKRITRSVKELRRHLPDSMPLSGLSICAVADRVVVKEGSSRWQAESGQYLLAFEGDPADGSLSVIERRDEKLQATAEDWFDTGVALETKDAEAALLAYERAVAADPRFLHAHINMGWLFHEAARFTEAERVYREAIRACGSDPTLLYNLGVLLDDMDRKNEAIEAYETALRGNPNLADCHYNLALLCEELKKPKEAIRHMAQYRRLVATKSE
ncbi:MAG: tetratricopeptide repeat protein [Burkholderiales bacterium]